MAKSVPSCDRIHLLRAAQNGDQYAQQKILEYFDSYVVKLATITAYAENGQSNTCLDEDIRVQVQATMIEKLPNFDLDGILQGKLPRKKKYGLSLKKVKSKSEVSQG